MRQLAGADASGQRTPALSKTPCENGGIWQSGFPACARGLRPSMNLRYGRGDELGPLLPKRNDFPRCFKLFGRPMIFSSPIPPASNARMEPKPHFFRGRESPRVAALLTAKS